MQAIVLAAGYATRLYPLTENVAKPLLPVAGRPMLDYLFDTIREVDEIDAIHVVTNHKFAQDFDRLGGRTLRRHASTTTARRARMTGSARSATSVSSSTEPTSTPTTCSSSPATTCSTTASPTTSVVARQGRRERARALRRRRPRPCEEVRHRRARRRRPPDELHREAGAPDRSTLVATARTSTTARTSRSCTQYLAEANSPDQPGQFLAWLVPRAPVYGYPSTATGATSATRNSCSTPITRSGSAPACRLALRIPSTRIRGSCRPPSCMPRTFAGISATLRERG